MLDLSNSIGRSQCSAETRGQWWQPFLSHEPHEATGRRGTGVSVGGGRLHDCHGAESNGGSETHSGTHASCSLTVAESLSQTWRPGTDRSDATTTNPTSTHTMR